MWNEILFFAVFLLQVFMLSLYYPNKVLERISYIFKHYPMETHEKLYPEGFEKASKGKTIFEFLARVILVISLIVYAVMALEIFVHGKGVEQLDHVPLLLGLVQVVPFFVLELFGFKHLKKMRAKSDAKKRSASLQVRSILRYVGSIELSVAAFVLLLCICLIVSINEFTLNFEVSTLLATLALSNGLFLALAYKLVYGKKIDPYQAEEDRELMTSSALRSFLLVSILISVYFIFDQLANIYPLSSWAGTINSLYWLTIAFYSFGLGMKTINIKDVNYDVYKTSASS
ncbi:hypothetical protein [Agaribacter flavus]|uniref:Integral membrane protein n=1 Tax=Agaribacter flavus TaxID=1902781 RepID=A0ABV7FRG2_9ALTE